MALPAVQIVFPRVKMPVPPAKSHSLRPSPIPYGREACFAGRPANFGDQDAFAVGGRASPPDQDAVSGGGLASALPIRFSSLGIGWTEARMGGSLTFISPAKTKTSAIMNTHSSRFFALLRHCSFALLAGAAMWPDLARAEVINFNSVTNGIWYGPVYFRDPPQLSDVYIAGPYLQPRLTAPNPANGTTALKLTAAPAGSYIVLSVGYHAPFALDGLDIVSISGTLIISDAGRGAYYTNNGTGRITLGSAFQDVTYVDLFVNGEVVIDNLNYTVLHHEPTAGIRVLNEMNRTPILPDHVPNHLGMEAAYKFPGYKQFMHYILAPSTNPVPFVVDGSLSISPDGEPLTYDWNYYLGGDDGDWYSLLGGAEFISPYFTNQPPYLNNSTSRQMVLRVRNDYYQDVVWFGVKVLTPELATTTLWGWLSDHFDRTRGPVRRRLIPTLRIAEEQFHNGETVAALDNLRRFNHQVRLIFRYAPEMRHTLLDFSRQIIDVVSAGATADAPGSTVK
jgi:hypothetical protein